MYYVYVIQSLKTNTYYIGCTEDLSKRLREHNRNRTKSTKNKGPWYLVYKEEIIDKHNALLRERYIKALKRGNAFKTLITKSSPSSSLA
ncbi:MAG: GIY-YIG nuclease family protein [Candidatus Omnitrophica bacterium]|nr:GIY-YIG nuclease family protein [Candidatus Omnitrophota bacterium]